MGGEEDAPGTVFRARVEKELGRILQSRTFSQSESLRRFLRHVVATTLDGREDELKELSLGAEVFERGESYDPRTDPIVRVQASRLRSKLRDFYAEEGDPDGVVIEIPKGTYVPTFRGGTEEGGRRPPRAAFTSVARISIAASVVLAAVVLVVALSRWLGSEEPDVASDPSEIRSLAVLPFADMSPARDYGFYGDGLAEEITTTLAAVSGLHVVPRTMAFQFDGPGQNLEMVASELRVDAILQGSVRQAGDLLRVQVQLIRTNDLSQLWSRTYDRPNDDAFAVQAEIAQSVARTVRKTLPASERPATDAPLPGAYEDYLRARFEGSRNTPSSLERSVRLFESAIAKDPDYAPAYAGLVEAYILNVLWGATAPSETRDVARRSSELALTLGGEHPEAVAAAAAYELFYEWDVAGAEALLERGLRTARGSSSAELHVAEGILKMVQGDLGGARSSLSRAENLSLDFPLATLLKAKAAFFSGETAQAARECRDLVERLPDYAHGWLLLARVASERGDSDEAHRALDRFDALAGTTAESLSTRATLFARENRDERARELLDRLEEEARERFVPPTLLVRTHAALGEVDAAIRILDAIVPGESFPPIWIVSDPDLAPIRQDPRYRAVLAELGLSG